MLKRFVLTSSTIISIFYLLLYIIKDPYCYGLLDFSILSSEIFYLSIILLLTIKLSFHFIKIKIIFWRIFLQTFLSTESKVYAFLSHGILIRIAAILIAIGCSIKVLLFFLLSPMHIHQFYILLGGCILFNYFRILGIYGKSASFLRNDIGDILKKYLISFVLATATGIFLSIWEIYNVENIHYISSYKEALQISLESIDSSNSILLHPIRVILRHIYLYDILLEQLNQFPIYGTPIYFIYLVISEGSVTFFSVYLILLPIRLKNAQDKS